MGRRGKLLTGVLSAVVLTGCGGSSHKSATANSATAASVSTTSVSTTRSTGSPTSAPASPLATELRTRPLRAGELSGFKPSQPQVVINPEAWVAVDQFSPAQRATVAARLRRLGFTGAVREDLTWTRGGSAGSANSPAGALSVVEQFRSGAAARAEFAAELPRLQPGSPISVPGVSGVRGFAAGSNGYKGANILFVVGSDLYLVGVGWPVGSKPAPTIASLVTAAQRLDRRTQH